MRSKRNLITIFVVLVLASLVQAYPSSGKGDSFHWFGDPYPRIVQQVFSHVERKYVEPDRASPRELLEGALRALETQYPEVLVEVDEESNTAKIRVDEISKTFDLAPADRFSSVAGILNTVLTFVANNLSGDDKKKDLYYFALNGALNVLDPHSNVFTPKHFKEFMIGTRGSFGGIGFVFGIRDGEMTIITPIEGTPADRGGLRSGDRILYIDGEPTINMPVDLAAGKMRGEPGTQVTLTLAREAWPEPKAITFTREIIHVDSVESYVLDGDGQTPVIYAKVKNFQKDTTDELAKAVEEAQASHPNVKGIVLDLRNNPGGLLEQAIALSDGFLDDGTIVATRGREASANSREVANDDRPISEKPLVVLVNQGSASASEIVSGALKADRAVLIGQKTFGKGSVQKLYRLIDGGALKLTVAQYLTPGDVSIQSIGIQPDMAVYPARVEAANTRLGPPPSHVAEADLKNAFTEWGNASDEPTAEVPYFEAAAEDEDDERTFAELGKEEKLARISENFEVRLARRLLGRISVSEGSNQRRALLDAASPVLEEIRAEEEAKISRELAVPGVDWSAGVSGEGVTLETVMPEEIPLQAGTTARVTLSVKNTGQSPAFRVWGRTDSDNPLLKNLDFAFGKVNPGEVKSWTAEVEVPKTVLDRWDLVTLNLRHSGAENASSGSGGARTVATERPDFSYVYEMTDENRAMPARSGDGVLEDGERVRLLLRVRNRGGAPSEKIEINIRGDEKEELYLEAARHRLDTLGPGQEADAPMAFRLIKADDEGKVSVGVSITDREHGSFFGDSLSFDVGKPYQAREARIPPSFKLAEAPPLRTDAKQIVLEIRAQDDEEVKDFYAYLGDKKIRYERNKEGQAELVVRLEVPLKEGSNRLMLAAHDQREILATRAFLIHRVKSDGGDSLGMK